MGMFFTAHLFRPYVAPDIPKSVLNAARAIGAYAQPTENKHGNNVLRISEKNGVYTAICPYSDGRSYFISQLAREFADDDGCIGLDARIQGGEHWDYSLRLTGMQLDSFSTCPYAFADDNLIAMSQKGRPDMLAEAWDIPVASIERYLRPWRELDPSDCSKNIEQTGKAYPTDEFEYGDYNQLFDLLKKLDFRDGATWHFELRIPKVNHSLKRHFVEDLSDIASERSNNK